MAKLTLQDVQGKSFDDLVELKATAMAKMEEYYNKMRDAKSDLDLIISELNK